MGGINADFVQPDLVVSKVVAGAYDGTCMCVCVCVCVCELYTCVYVYVCVCTYVVILISLSRFGDLKKYVIKEFFLFFFIFFVMCLHDGCSKIYIYFKLFP
jgi:hypothetical protein